MRIGIFLSALAHIHSCLFWTSGNERCIWWWCMQNSVQISNSNLGESMHFACGMNFLYLLDLIIYANCRLTIKPLDSSWKRNTRKKLNQIARSIVFSRKNWDHKFPVIYQVIPEWHTSIKMGAIKCFNTTTTNEKLGVSMSDWLNKWMLEECWVLCVCACVLSLAHKRPSVWAFEQNAKPTYECWLVRKRKCAQNILFFSHSKPFVPK